MWSSAQLDLRDTAEEAEFRRHARQWIAGHLPPGLRGLYPRIEQLELAREWSRAMSEAGYAGLTWPREYGGQGMPLSMEAIWLEELAGAEAPQHLGVIGLGMAGPTIMAHGTEDQRQRHLPRILDASEIWCQGFSEPGAGSDLAALRTRAEARPGGFLVNGQKVWSSYAHIADWCILLTRTDPTRPSHQGMTFFLVDMHSPGVEVRPIRQLTGDSDFNEIFLTDVLVPEENVVGEVGEGWQVAMTTLLHERGTLGFALAGSLDTTVRKLVELARERAGGDARLRDLVAREWITTRALQLTAQRSLGQHARTGIPGPEGSIVKLTFSETNQRVAKLARELLGEEAVMDDGAWLYQQLRSRGNTIEAGTSEVLRSIVAERVLGLPRSR
jgi:alkylation response protein AidB-like acyl-CoA dehydrogenase